MASRALRASEFLPRRGEGGFTLLEVVLAFTILALLVAVLYGVFFVSHRAVEKAELRAEESQKVRAAEEFLGGYIRSAYPYLYATPAPAQPVPFFRGDESRVEFVSALSVGLGGRGMAKIRLSWDASGAVVLEEEMPVGPNRLDQPDDATPGHRSRLTLWQGVTQFRLGYLDGRRERETWVGRWDGAEQKALPRAVRLSVRDAAGGELLWDFPVMMRALLP